jgi:hypothetical protein
LAPGACLTSAKSYCFYSICGARLAFTPLDLSQRSAPLPSVAGSGTLEPCSVGWPHEGLARRCAGRYRFLGGCRRVGTGGPSAWMGFDHLPVARHPNGCTPCAHHSHCGGVLARARGRGLGLPPAVLTGALVSWAVLFALAAFAIRRDARALLMRRSQAPRMGQ